MLERANRNKQISRAENILFIESSITDVGLPNETAHCIISNCVVNLVPEQEKQLVFNEMYRLLKPGGRTAISDILVKRDLPEELKNDIPLYVGCIAGASLVQDYEKYLRNAGFAGKQFSPTSVERATNVNMTV
jgi:arsenite methyltransferase